MTMMLFGAYSRTTTFDFEVVRFAINYHDFCLPGTEYLHLIRRAEADAHREVSELSPEDAEELTMLAENALDVMNALPNGFEFSISDQCLWRDREWTRMTEDQADAWHNGYWTPNAVKEDGAGVYFQAEPALAGGGLPSDWN